MRKEKKTFPIGPVAIVVTAEVHRKETWVLPEQSLLEFVLNCKKIDMKTGRVAQWNYCDHADL